MGFGGLDSSCSAQQVADDPFPSCFSPVRSGHRCLPPKADAAKFHEVIFALLLGTSSRVVQAQLHITTSKEDRRGRHTGKTTSTLKLREDCERKEFPLRLITDGVKLCVPIQTYRLLRKDDEEEDVPAPDQAGASDHPPPPNGQGRPSASSARTGSGNAVLRRGQDAPDKVPKPSGKSSSRIKARDLKEPEYRTKLIEEIFAPRKGSRGYRSKGGIDPNKREPAVGIIKVLDFIVASMLNGQDDGYAFANKHLAAVDTEITEFVTHPDRPKEQSLIRYAVIRGAVPDEDKRDGTSKPADLGLTMGPIIGFRSKHFCSELRNKGPNHVCGHLANSLRHSLRFSDLVNVVSPDLAKMRPPADQPPDLVHIGSPQPVEVRPPADQPPADVEMPDARAVDGCHHDDCDAFCFHHDHHPEPAPTRPVSAKTQKVKDDRKERQDARNAKLFPEPSGEIPAASRRTFWAETGLRGPREACEIVRRVSLEVYRRKSNILRNAKALEKELKEGQVDGISAADWQRKIPTSQTSYLSTYLTYVHYILKSLGQIIAIYAQSELRCVFRPRRPGLPAIRLTPSSLPPSPTQPTESLVLLSSKSRLTMASERDVQGSRDGALRRDDLGFRGRQVRAQLERLGLLADLGLPHSPRRPVPRRARRRVQHL